MSKSTLKCKSATLTKQERWDYSKRDIISLRDEFRLDKLRDG